MATVDRSPHRRTPPRRGPLPTVVTLLLSLLCLTSGQAAAPLQIIPKGGEPPGPQAPPLSLTSSDGTGLKVVALRARAVVEDPLAFTELQLTFRNPEPRVVEGQFEITLPPGATISRFAMRLGDRWQEGEVVELQAAREAYEDFLHRRQDPALLEKQAGNSFRARVFPIPPSGEKELIVSFSQERPRASDPYRIYLKGLPQLEHLDIRALLGKSAGAGVQSSLGGTTLTHQVIEVKKDRFTPDVDFEVAVPAPADGRAGLRHDNLAVARVTPVGEVRPDVPQSLLVLLDTSASRALGFGAQLAALREVLGQLGKDSGGKLPLRVLCFDQEVEEVYTGPIGGFGDKQLGRVVERRPLGASDLGRALRFVAAHKGYSRVLLVSDGVSTAGVVDGAELRALAKGLGAAGVERLDALAVGGIRDGAMLSKLVTAGLARDGVVADGDVPLGQMDQVALKLRSATFSGIQVAVAGAAWVWPQELSGVQPGDQVLVYADLPRDRPFQVTLRGAGQSDLPKTVPLVPAPRPLLERAWINARIQRIQHQRDTVAASDPDLREGLRKQIIELSTKYRVLSDYTALLVLETEADYQRFRIDRRALSDILTVGSSGIELLNRKSLPIAVAAPPPQRPIDDNDSSLGLAKDEEARVETKPSPRRAAATEGREKKKADAPALAAPAMKAPPAPKPRPADPMKSVAAERDNRASRADGGAAAGPRVSYPRNMMPAGDAAPAPEPRAEAARQGARRPPSGVGGASGGAPMSVAAPPPPPPPPSRQMMERVRTQPLEIAKEQQEPPYEGKLLAVMTLLKGQRKDEALRQSRAWRDEEPGDVLALVALGEVAEALGNRRLAARAYGSIIDLFPGRADLRRFAGERLERVAPQLPEAAELTLDTYRKAREQRPDHPASHRLLAYALLRSGRPGEAFEAMAAGVQQSYPPGRFNGVLRILQEDLGLIAAAWLAREKDPGRRKDINDRLASTGVPLSQEPSLRFVLNWETDANDVDFHIFDGQGGHAYYSSRALASGGELYADVTTGYGPECFTIPGKARAFPYRLQAHYYSRGPMGYGMGKLQIIEHDGRGNLRFADRPFVIMKDRAFVDLGQVAAGLN